MRQLHRTVTAIAALALIGLAAPSSPAAAADPDIHCVASADSGDTSPLRCFDTFDNALQFASGGVLIKQPKGGTIAARVAAINAGFGTLSARLVLSIEYTGQNWTGSSLIWTGTSGTCSNSLNNIDYQIPSMPVGWNNVTTSFQSFANCWVKHYESNNYGGAVVGYGPTDAFIGAVMDDQTSSQRWS